MKKLNKEQKTIADSSPGSVANALVVCSCGKPLIAVLNAEGKQIGVTHDTYENEDWHNEYWSTNKIIERIKSN